MRDQGPEQTNIKAYTGFGLYLFFVFFLRHSKTLSMQIRDYNKLLTALPNALCFASPNHTFWFIH